VPYVSKRNIGWSALQSHRSVGNCSVIVDLYANVQRFIISDFSLRRSSMACVNDGSHSFTSHPHVYPHVEWAIPAFSPQLQSISALWLVFISRPTEGRRLSCPGWLGEILRWFAAAHPKTVTRPSTDQSSWESSSRLSRCESSALTTRPPSHITCLLYKHVETYAFSTSVITT